jgi:hypothetical protein
MKFDRFIFKNLKIYNKKIKKNHSHGRKSNLISWSCTCWVSDLLSDFIVLLQCAFYSRICRKRKIRRENVIRSQMGFDKERKAKRIACAAAIRRR